MGRTKGVPKRRREEEGQYLGMLASEIVDVTEHIPPFTIERARPPRVLEDEEKEAYLQDRERSGRRKPRRLNFDDEEEGEEDDAENNEAAEVTPSSDSSVAVEQIETTPPGVEIVVETSDVNDTNTAKPTTILYYHRTPSVDSSGCSDCDEDKIDSSSSPFLLHTIVLDADAVRLKPASTNNEPPQLPFQITSYEAAVTLLDFCQTSQLATNTLARTDNIASAVHHGLLDLRLSTTKDGTTLVALSLADSAFAMCQPSMIHHRARQNSKLYQKAVILQQALVDLFPDDSQLLATPHQATNKTNAIITAKQVYSLVDNVQYKAFLEQKPSANNDTSLDIPGLRPTLRPYQEAAVRWMIEREGQDTVAGDEWELAWVAILVETKRKGAGVLVSNRNLSFLPEYSSRLEKDYLDGCFYFCPVTGWLASTYEEAREMTIGDMGKLSNNHHMANPVTGGGILAESMGLGKSVEVLALIMANPDPVPRTATDLSTSTCTASLSTFSENAFTSQMETDSQIVEADCQTIGDGEKVPADLKCRKPIPSQQPTSPAAVADVNSAMPFAVPPQNIYDELNDAVSDSEDNGSAQMDTDAVVGRKVTVIGERWLEGGGHELGSCICGEPISILSKTKSTVICEQCLEPMHMDCAAFESLEKETLHATSDVVLFKRRFSEHTVSCAVCPKSLCPCCVAEDAKARSKIRSGATVIVTPPAILSQWESEIRRHVHNAPNSSSDTAECDGSGDSQSALKVAVYPGIKELMRQQQARRDGTKNFHLLHPRWLAKADIVLMTFDALHQDLGHSDSNPYAAGATGKSLRKRKRYRVVPSPLSSIKWWRVCLDEAQRVETPTAGSAQMALKLDAKHRWAVSGTPIGSGKLQDLFGLLLFLRIVPFSDITWFRRAFAGSIDGAVGDRIKHLLHSIFWRSTKSWDLVRIQMGVPDQIEKKEILKFSSVERHFYDRQLEETHNLAGDMTEKSAGKRRGEVLANQLHKLRAACCHPQVGSSGMAKTKKGRVSDGISSKVLSMEQILDQLIDDTQTKCEEALRLSLFHSNPMATITRLKVEAKNQHNVADIEESDETLLSHSCRLYQDTLDLADEHATPYVAIGEATLSGSAGFRSSQKHIREAKAVVDWQVKEQLGDDNKTRSGTLWAIFAFNGRPKKLKQIRARAVTTIPHELRRECSHDFSWDLIYPKDCVLQASCAAVGGEFIDVAKFAIAKPEIDESGEASWEAQSGLWLQKSKIWRLVVTSYHDEPEVSSGAIGSTFLSRGHYAGLEVELHEAAIASDPLQRLHTLHNACVSLRELKSEQLRQDPAPSLTEISTKIELFQQESDKIESHVLRESQTIHSESRRRLANLVDGRKNRALELSQLSSVKDTEFLDDVWFEDIVAYVKLHGNMQEQTSLAEKAKEAMDSSARDKAHASRAFPAFDDLQGLLVGLKLRFAEVRSAIGHGQYSKTIQSALELPSKPTLKEIFDNQHCGVCKADWYRTGPKCQHCLLSDKLRQFNPDAFSGQCLDILSRNLLKAILTWTKGARVGVRGSNPLKILVARGTKYFDVLEASRKEVLGATSFWIAHLELLNMIDEIDSSKRPMRLLQPGEDLSKFTEEEKGAIVVPVDVKARYHEHAAKQAMSLSNLRRHKQTLQFLKNQRSEQGKGAAGNQNDEWNESCETCPVCLSVFDNDRAVLSCGHSFHLSPCLDKLKKRSGAGGLISCPLRCTIRTKVGDVMVATTKRHDDGSQSKRKVKGSYGTKVTAITADLLSVSDLGEKSIVFSMWEDMLDIIEEVLTANGIHSVRATSKAQIGQATKRFRSPDCSVLLLNVKNGAEGLTLVEATHVFMVEPMLNYGLDSQARARCHRIGQTRTSYLHRYLIEDTIEMKIDKIRMQHQEYQLEDDILNTRKCSIKAGGIDGGFASQEELMDILKL